MRSKQVVFTGVLMMAAFFTRPIDATRQAAAGQAAPTPVVVEVTLNEWKVEMPTTTLKAGPTTFKTTNAGEKTHTLKVESDKLEDKTLKKISKELPHDLKTNEKGEMTIDLKPGTYKATCPIGLGAHKRHGMELAFTVVARQP